MHSPESAGSGRVVCGNVARGTLQGGGLAQAPWAPQEGGRATHLSAMLRVSDSNATWQYPCTANELVCVASMNGSAVFTENHALTGR